MPRALISAILFAAQFLFLPNPSPAQSYVPSNSSCPCNLQGSVVDAVSGQPVPHALVKASSPLASATLTDSEGKFQFEGLPAGPVTLEAEKPAYVSGDTTGPHLSIPVSFGLSPGSAPAILKLTPEGTIFGQVTDERGEPLEGFNVAVWTRIFSADARMDEGVLESAAGIGKVGFSGFSNAHTDDEGKFRIAKLSPGSYFLFVGPPQGAVQNSSAKSSVPSGYAPVYYPRTDDFSSAAPIKLLPGKSVQANFSLKREPFVRISGTVSGYNSGDQVSLTLRAGAGVQDPHIVFDPAKGSFYTSWIPPGPYTVTAQAKSVALPDGSATSSSSTPVLESVQVHGPSPGLFASQHINAVSSVSDLRLVLQPTVDIQLIVHGLPANAVRADFLPRLFALVPKSLGASSPVYFSDWENPGDVRSLGDLRMMFYGVPPGTYELNADGPYNASFYVESASSGSINLLHENLVLSASIPPIDIVLRDDAATLSGTVFTSAAPVSGAVVVVLLSDSRGKPTTLAIDPSRVFSISGLAPGTYRVFATEPALNPDYLDPAFLQRISSKVQEVTLTPKQSASINLELATVEE